MFFSLASWVISTLPPPHLVTSRPSELYHERVDNCGWARSFTRFLAVLKSCPSPADYHQLPLFPPLFHHHHGLDEDQLARGGECAIGGGGRPVQ
jgi:hypothetical protein